MSAEATTLADEALGAKLPRGPQVPVSMLRKGDGLTPLQHRGISVFTSHYRLSAGVWWHRIIPSLLLWIDKDACGAVPGRECLEAAFDAMLDFEYCMLTQTEQTQIGADYDKFFDTIDQNFMHKLHIAIGLPPALAVQLVSSESE